MSTLRAAALLLVLGAAGAGAFIYSGIYDIAARRPHTKLVRSSLGVMQQRSVQLHARNVEVPPLDRPEFVQRGLVLYRELCVVCHGGPGERRDRVGIGLNPNPPPLLRTAYEWSPAELYWILANGLKLAGMPAFGLGKEQRELWALTAFLVQLPRITPEEYRRMIAAIAGGTPDAAALPPPGRPSPGRSDHRHMPPIEWVRPTDPGVRLLLEEASTERGRMLIDSVGCGACHTVPGVRDATGRVGPPLTRWGERHFLAGFLLNEPDMLTMWLQDPGAVKPGTGMPNLGLTPVQARDIAAYLYTLGDSPTAGGVPSRE